MIEVIIEIDDMRGYSVHASIKFLPSRGDWLQVDAEISPELHQSLRDRFSAEPGYFEVLFVEQHLCDPQAKVAQTVPVIHVRHIPFTYYIQRGEG